MATVVGLGLLLAMPVEPDPAPWSLYPIKLSWYNPELGGINCNSDCQTIATGKLLSHHYNTTAACLPEWIGKQLTIEGLGSWLCRDTGGAVRMVYDRQEGRVVIRVDLLRREPIQPGPFERWTLE